MKYYLSIFFTFLFAGSLYGQRPATVSSAQILHGLQKLQVLGSVLYIAAHPDDENTRLITFLANEKKYRTGMVLAIEYTDPTRIRIRSTGSSPLQLTYFRRIILCFTMGKYNFVFFTPHTVLCTRNAAL